jgi:hypothetical protein
MDNVVFKEFKDHINIDIYKFNEHEEVKFIELNGQEWKWYSDFDDVKAWHQLLNEANKLGLATEFVRVGEDPDDIEISQDDGDGDDGCTCEYVLCTYTTIDSIFGD